MEYSIFPGFLVFLALAASLPGGEASASKDGYKLESSSQYFLVAPRRVRPNMVYQAHVTLYALWHDHLDVRLSLSRNGVEYATGVQRFFSKGTRTVQLQVPDYVTAGEHKLVVEGVVSEDQNRLGHPIFRNETQIEFHSKYVSIFVQTDNPVYYPEQTVFFRVLGVYPGTLKPAHGPMVIFLKDAKGNIVQRWLSYQLNFGMFSSSFQLTYPVNVGTWSIRVEAFGHVYEDYKFLVEFFYQRTFHVNVTTPMTITDTEWGLGGSIYGEHLSGKAASGNCTISLRVREQDGTFLQGELQEKFSYMTGTFPFKFSMSAIRKEFGEVAGKDLFVKGWIHDFYWLETQNGTSVTHVVRDGVDLKVLGRRIQTFKPRTPFYVYFVLVSSDGTPYRGLRNRIIHVQKTHESYGATSTPPEEIVMVPDDGVVRYQVAPRDNDKKIHVWAWHDTNPGDIKEIEVFRYYSKHDRFLSVTTSTEKPRVDEYMVFTLRTNFFIPEVSYLISAGDDILLTNQLIMSQTGNAQKTFSVAVSRQMAPRARIVVFCMLEGEWLTDSLNFFVEDTRLGQATLTVNLGKDFERDTIEILGRGAPGGFLGMSGLDYEFYRRGAAPFLNREKMIEELSTYDAPNEGPHQYIWWHNDDRWEESVFFNSPTSGMDMLSTFKVSGLVALSNTNLTVPPEAHLCNETLGLGRCLNGHCFERKKECDGFIDCEDGTDEIACPWTYTPERKPPALADLSPMPRYFADAEWMWKTTYVKHTGQTEIKLDVPLYTNPHVMSGFIIHPEQGLAVVQQVAQYDSTRTFFMYAEAPSAARRGEQIGVRLLLYSTWDQNMECIVTLHAGEGYRFIRVEQNGYVSSYSPRTESGDVQIMVELPAGGQKYVHMPVLPIIESGDLTITFSAHSFVDHDVQDVEIAISMDGSSNGDYMPYLVDLVNHGSVIIPDFDIPIPERFIHPEQRELIYLPGSNEAVVQVFGDVVSPGFFQSHLDTDSTTGMPHDSAEGYMYDFAINLQTLLYLQATNALSADNLADALEYMKSVLMRQYAYMQDDGSFKQFRRTEKPCVWLTSFILRTLHTVKESEWDEQLYIHVDLLNKIAMWLVSQQNSTTGAFAETAERYYNRDMEPWTTDNNTIRHEWHIPVTAHVTITLAGCTRLTGEAKNQVDTAKFLAADYLADKINDITDPYQMAVVAYALYKTAHRNSEHAYVRLKSMRREGEWVYWAHKEIEPNPVTIVNTVPLMQPRDYFTNEGNAVVATSYALRLYLAHNELLASKPIMKWLQTQHNDMMRFSSTQDSLIALEALTDYAMRETNRAFYRMDIHFEATSNRAWKHKVTFNGTNFADLTELVLPNAWGQIKAHAQGTGYAYIGVSSSYNTEKIWQVSGPSFDAYDFSVDQLSFSGRNASVMDLQICTRWLRPDISPESGMMNILVDIPTGHVVARDAIEEVYNSRVPGLRRVRFRDQTLIVFFDYMSTTKTCFKFRAHRWYPVANVSIPHLVNLYEYAETGIQFNTQYDTFTLFHLHICQVCGSFQCPYCANYNSAGRLKQLPIVHILCLLCSIFLCWITGKYS